MTRHIVLDSYPLSLLSVPVRGTAMPVALWAADCIAAGHQTYVPEVIDYELRRELLRARKSNSIAALNALRSHFDFIPICSNAMLLAADLWADARQKGFATGDPKKLDIDVILASQALTLSAPASDIVIATSNVAHLSHFVAADLWSNITP